RSGCCRRLSADLSLGRGHTVDREVLRRRRDEPYGEPCGSQRAVWHNQLTRWEAQMSYRLSVPRFRCIEDRRGIAAAELAILAPVVIVLMMGVGELGQRLLINQRLSTAASRIGDLITHETSLTANRLATVFDAASRLINQDDFANDGTVIITGIGGEPGG